MKKTTKIIIASIYVITLLAILAYMNFGQLHSFMVIGLALIVCLLPLFFLKPKYSLLGLLIIRPAIDIYAPYQVFNFLDISFNVNYILGIGVFCWGLFYIIIKRINIFKIPNFLPIAFFFLISLLSLPVTITLIDTAGEIIKISNIFMFYIIAFWLCEADNKFINKIIIFIGLGAVIPIIMAIYQFIYNSGLNFGDFTNRVYGTFGHPNVLAFYLVLCLAILLIRFLNIEKNKRHPLWLVAFGIIFIVLLLTYTRAAWIGLVVYLFVLGMLYYRKQFLIGLAGLSIIIILGLGINYLLVTNLSYDLTRLPLISRMTTRSEDSDSIAWRLTVLSEMSVWIAQAPLLGQGLGAFPLLRKMQDVGLYEDLNAHNDYLRLAVEIGFLGLFAYLLIYVSLFKNAIKKFILAKYDSYNKKISLSLIAILCAFLVMSVSDNMLQHTAVMWAFWTVCGAFSAVGITEARSNGVHGD